MYLCISLEFCHRQHKNRKIGCQAQDTTKELITHGTPLCFKCILVNFLWSLFEDPSRQEYRSQTGSPSLKKTCEKLMQEFFKRAGEQNFLLRHLCFLYCLATAQSGAAPFSGPQWEIWVCCCCWSCQSSENMLITLDVVEFSTMGLLLWASPCCLIWFLMKRVLRQFFPLMQGWFVQHGSEAVVGRAYANAMQNLVNEDIE